jgi:hypothetical protein
MTMSRSGVFRGAALGAVPVGLVASMTAHWKQELTGF